MADEDMREEEKPLINYDALDEQTGFKQAEIDIWRAFEDQVVNKPEDDRPDVESWVDEFAEEKGYDRKRVKYVATLGIYAGTRDEFNQRSGSGKAIFANGDVYEGEYFEGQKHGHGHYTFKATGKAETDVLIEKLIALKSEHEPTETFVKRVAEQLKIGEMIVKMALTYGFFPCYVGDYHLGVRTGRGEMKCKDGSYYRGEWVHNKRNGKGMLYYVNGDVYSGDWEKGLKHGAGAYRFANGCEYRGKWVQGNFTEGQWLMPDGAYFEGVFDKKNRPVDPEGKMHFPGREMVVSGAFRKGIWAPQNNIAVSDEKADEEEWAE
jgi:hypothetical protein